MFLLSLLLAFAVGGFAWRVRGSGLIPTDTESRYGVWGIPVGMLVGIATANPLYGLLAVPLAGLGATIGYWGQFDFSVPGNWNILNYVKLTLVGMMRFVPLFVMSILVHLQWHVLPGVFAGTVFVPVYMLSFKYLSKLNLGSLFNQPSCYGEFLYGAVIYTALALGLVL